MVSSAAVIVSSAAKRRNSRGENVKFFKAWKMAAGALP
jgi:hypothetical protein